MCLTFIQFARMSKISSHSFGQDGNGVVVDESVAIVPTLTTATRKAITGLVSTSTSSNFTVAPRQPSIETGATATAGTMTTDATSISSSKSESTLALLVPPGMIGGYRNQYLRFCSMVWYAKQQSIPQLLLPSILWSTTYKAVKNERFFYPIPMQLLFDVEHWNTYYPHLPRLVKSINATREDHHSNHTEVECWEDLDAPLGRALLDGRRSVWIEEVKRDANRSSVNDTSSLFFESPMTEMLLRTSGYLRPIANQSIDYYIGKRKDFRTVRKTDYSSQVQHCTNPKVVGGGIGAGTLWYMWTNNIRSKLLEESYTSHKKGTADFKLAYETGNLTKQNRSSVDEDADESPDSNLMTFISQALRPHQQWRDAAHQCIHHHLHTRRQRRHGEQEHKQSDSDDRDSGNAQILTTPPYLALHARVEVDMMVHKCGRLMEKNLTKIFDMVDSFISDYNNNNTEKQRILPLEGTFVAVSRNGMKLHTKNNEIQNIAENNWEILNIRSPQYHRDAGTPASEEGNEYTTPIIFECGETWMEKWYNSSNNMNGNKNQQSYDFYGSIVPSIINFYIGTQATVFVGVDKSSWSTDVWTTRYHLGKGHTNFRYTQDQGVIPVDNGGLPPPHNNC